MPKNSFANANSFNEALDALINEQEAARFLGFTPRALQNWRFRGGGPLYIKVGGRSVRYRKRDLLVWAQTNEVANSADSTGRSH